VIEQGWDVAAREDAGEVLRASGAFESFERGHVEFEDPAVEEHQRAEGLIPGRGGGATPDRDVVEEGGDLGGAQLTRVAAVVEADGVAYPADVRLLGARGVVEAANRPGDARGKGARRGARSADEPGWLRGNGDTGTEIGIGNWAASGRTAAAMGICSEWRGG
jgi:hypothetical protein